ncbi:MAG: hypothetical protein HWD83_10355 [Gammaproteobacteria bacterium]|nr:hypothetical protein [Gammaproteobacteria bacterium]
MSPEVVVGLINLCIIAVGYLCIYPLWVRNDRTLFFINDSIASVMALLISGSLFWNRDITFNLMGLQLNWFWFALITYMILETPFALRYAKRYQIDLFSNRQDPD